MNNNRVQAKDRAASNLSWRTLLGVMLSLGGVVPGHAEEGSWGVLAIAKQETAVFVSQGSITGAPASTSESDDHTLGQPAKFETSLTLFFNEMFTDETTLHGQLNLVHEVVGLRDQRGHQVYSQNDYLRELYLDTRSGPIQWRVGKQQTVWGTADGMKLLDILNPTDFREFVQNTMEDSRIPVWMIKAGIEREAYGNLQLVVAQHRPNRVPGLNAQGDAGHPFILKGVDAITGPVYGFRNIVPEMGTLSGNFMGAFGAIPLKDVTFMTVDDFATNPNAMPGQSGDAVLRAMVAGMGGVTHLIDGGSWNIANPDSVFEYMPNATLATFDAFVGATTTYRVDYPDETEPNLGLRYKGTLGLGFNYTLNYLWHYDPNPYVTMHWEGVDGTPLQPETTPGVKASDGTPTTTLTLPGHGGDLAQPATLVFTEKLNRIHSFGGSFNTDMDLPTLGTVVLRGEVLYQKDTMVPVVDRTKLAYGDLVGALHNEETDFLKYVLGADITLFTNLMISGQFIQFINLDTIDENNTGTAYIGRYTADPAVMHLSNGLRPAETFKAFYSLFLSKPFGEEQLGRVNTILILEEGGGYWNRLDMEYAFTDQWVGVAEWNHYFGDRETLFGQFAHSSNLQLGLKYIFSP